MPPKLKVKGKGKGKGRKKGKKRKGKKKKVKKEILPLPLHLLTELYNQLRDKIFDLKRTQVKARKKRLEGWFLTREMLNLKHDNQVYHDYLKEKMDDIRRLIQEIMAQLEKERAETDKIIKERMNEYDRKIAEYKARMGKGEIELSELRVKLLEYEPLIKKLAALLARLRELEALIPAAELEANIKTRHLKNQYLIERAKLHNHLESELYKLITTCRAHLMPILADHMHYMEFENRCNRWDLSRLDIANAKFSQDKELLLEKRNRLNMERGYLSLEWAFNKLAVSEAKRKEIEMAKKMHKHPEVVEDCELAVAFKQYLNKKLTEERLKKETEMKILMLQRRKEEKRRLFEIAREKAKRDAARSARLSRPCLVKKGNRRQLEALDGEEEEDGEEEDEFYNEDWEDMEYYEDEDGNLVIAPAGRMKQHKGIMENKSTDDLDDDDLSYSDDDSSREDEENDEDEDGEGEGSSSSSGGSGKSDSGITVNNDEQDYGQDFNDLDDDSSNFNFGKGGISDKSSVISASTKSSKM